MVPTPRTIKKHKGVARIRTKRLSNGTLLRIYFYGDGDTRAEEVERKRRGKAKR